MNATYNKCEQMNLPITGNVIFSRASADGASPCASPASPMISPCGPAVAPASHSAPPASRWAARIRAIYGRRSDALSTAGVLQSCLASRLQARLGVNGSPEYLLTWKQWAIRRQAPICALRASARQSSDKDCGFLLSGWTTPIASEVRQGFQDRSRGKKGTQESLTTQAVKNLDTTGGGDLKTVWLVQPQQPRLEGHTRHEHNWNQSRWLVEESSGSASEAGAVSFWSRCVIIPCKDGNARRAEPESFPLVDGLPNRVGLLRGYGNAIVPQLAAQFIQASFEVLNHENHLF